MVKEYMDRIEELKVKIKEIDDEIKFISGYTAEEEEEAESHQYEQYMNSDEYKINQLNSERDKLSDELKELVFKKEQISLSKKYLDDVKYHKKGNFLTDTVPENDLLGRKHIVRVIVGHILNKNITTPINIGVFGHWGDGKSAFLDLVEKEILDLNSKEYEHICNTHIVKFDASEYDEKSKIWISILKSFYDAYEKKHPFKSKFTYAWQKFRKNFKSNLIRYFLNAFLYGFIAVLFFLWYKVSGLKVTPENLIDGTIAEYFDTIIKNKESKPTTSLNDVIYLLTASLTFAVGIIKPLIKVKKNIVKPVSSKIVSYMESPDFESQLGEREYIKTCLNNLLEIWIKGSNDRIVLFVDELDRCNEKTVTEFFDALQLLLSVKGITSIISVNYESVCYALAESNKHYFNGDISNEEKLEFGMKYLQKYINIPLHLAKYTNYRPYLSSIADILNRNVNTQEEESSEISQESTDDVQNENVQETFNAKNEAYSLTDEELSIIKLFIQRIEIRQHITAREVKKIVNILMLSKEVILYEDESASAIRVDFRIYIYWFFMHYFSVDMYAYYKQRMCEVQTKPYKLIKDEDTKLESLSGFEKGLHNELRELNLSEVRYLNNVSSWFIYCSEDKDKNKTETLIDSDK